MDREVFRFAFITDTQIGMNSPFGLHGPGSDKARLDAAIAYINAQAIDFVILGGDQIHQIDGPDTDAQLDILETSLSALTMPYYGVTGNHDQGDPSKSWKYIARGLPVRFSFVHKNSFLVGVNAAWLRGDFGDAYQQEAWQNLVSALTDSPATCKHRFVVMHWPLFTAYPEEPDDGFNMPNRSQLIDLLAQHSVSCVLAGHWHQDIEARWRGVSLITSAGTSRAVQYPEQRAFKVITVFDDGWSVRRVSVE